MTDVKTYTKIVPAAPGSYVAWPHEPGPGYSDFFIDTPKVQKLPVIAWKIEYGGGLGSSLVRCAAAAPITIDADINLAIEEGNKRSSYALLNPEGSVVYGYLLEKMADSVEEWLADTREARVKIVDSWRADNAQEAKVA